MSLFNTDNANGATPTDAGVSISVEGVFDVLTKVFGFCRTIIDFLKGIFTPLFKSLFESVANKTDETVTE